MSFCVSTYSCAENGIDLTGSADGETAVEAADACHWTHATAVPNLLGKSVWFPLRRKYLRGMQGIISAV